MKDLKIFIQLVRESKRIVGLDKARNDEQDTNKNTGNLSDDFHIWFNE